MKTEIPLYDPMTEVTGQESRVSKGAVLSFLCAWLLALTVPAAVQQPKKVPRIGFVTGNRQELSVTEFQRALGNLGYIEGKNIVVEHRYTGGMTDRIVAELVQLKPDVLVSTVPSAIRAAKQATSTIPVVFVTTGDPVAEGLVDNWARPGGNITGLTRLTRDLSGKRLELVKELLPRISRVGILWTSSSTVTTGFKAYEAPARALKIQLQSMEVRGPNPDFERAFRDAAKGHVSALVTVSNRMLTPYPKEIANLAVRNRLPSMFETSYYVEFGGLMSYAANDAEVYRRAATYVDKILKGAKPAELPVEQPTKFEFIVNLKTAKQIGLTISPNVLARADKIIR